MSASKLGRGLAIFASVVVVATLVAAMFAIGSPASQRESRLDRKREQELERIVNAIDSHVGEGKPLPADLALLARQPGRQLSITDPATGVAYGYQLTGQRSYRLCAVFATDTARETGDPWIEENWLHGAGLRCFDRKLADKKN